MSSLRGKKGIFSKGYLEILGILRRIEFLLKWNQEDKNKYKYLKNILFKMNLYLCVRNRDL